MLYTVCVYTIYTMYSVSSKFYVILHISYLKMLTSQNVNSQMSTFIIVLELDNNLMMVHLVIDQIGANLLYLF